MALSNFVSNFLSNFFSKEITIFLPKKIGRKIGREIGQEIGHVFSDSRLGLALGHLGLQLGGRFARLSKALAKLFSCALGMLTLSIFIYGGA
jgi:hypothetical protein